MKLGVCYYPEHWPEYTWKSDAARMADMGLEIVRLGEFSWSRIEPQRDDFHWGWLDIAIDILAENGLKLVLGTPTACPPKWLIDECPEILAVDQFGHSKRFGSRRHYCFSSTRYRKECTRIVTAMVKRYGAHPAVIAWQTDNEYGCHETTLSYSKDAAAAFRRWLEQRYGSIEELNEAWGNVFWSQEYNSFSEVDPPMSAVTEMNPSHRLDYNRFASDEVVSFNRLQVDLIRQHAPHADVLHNFMGFYTEFDHHRVGQDLDVSTWDSYPLGFLERSWFNEQEKQAYLRQGHPDFAAFHHDLYRGCSNGRMWVMEQQPGPVNWAAYNPAPLPGMVRTWTWEAYAHGAEVVSYFRWRQVPFAQEQMHSGLNLPNGEPDTATMEVCAVAGELGQLRPTGPKMAKVALVFGYESEWVTRIQPHGEDFSSLVWSFNCYTALRELGLDLDIISPTTPMSGYQLVICPCIPIVGSVLADSLKRLDVPVFLGMRTGSKTENFHVPDSLPPGDLGQLIPLRISRVESLQPGASESVIFGEKTYRVEKWFESVQSDLEPLAETMDGKGIWFRHNKIHYLAAWPDPEFLRAIMMTLCHEAGLATEVLPRGIRTRNRGNLKFIFNYNNHEVSIDCDPDQEFELGNRHVAPGGLAALFDSGPE